jgi:phage terminase small subunit
MPNKINDPDRVVRNPAVGVQLAEAELMLKLGRELGLTPSGRTGLHTGRDDGDAAERLLS